MTNMTYANVTLGEIDESMFAHPEAKEQKGTCGQFGVDPRCSQADADAMLAEHAASTVM